MIDQEFDFVVSLGGNCETTYQIRRRFGCERTQVFDWFVTPTLALVEMVENDFAEMFIDENMKVIFDGDGVICNRYGTVHFHDFPEAHPEGKYVQTLVTEGCAKNRQKFNFLANRLRELKGRVLFIRADDGFVTGGDRNGDFTPALFSRLTSALEKILPEADFKVLLLRGSFRSTDPRLHVDIADKHGETRWQGSDQGWNEMFERQAIRYANPAVIGSI